MSGYNEFEFNQMLTDIEKYLGYLRGNELAYEYMRSIEESFSGGEGTMLFVEPFDEGYRYPCPEDRFKVKPVVPMHLYLGAGTKPREFVKLVQQSMDASYHNGDAWSAGIASYARSVCDQFTKPDVNQMVTAMDEMQSLVVDRLAVGAVDDWAQLGSLNDRWTGDGAREFNTFYNNFNDVLHTFATFSAFVNWGACVTTGIIDGTQQGAMRFVRDIRDNLVKQLEAWTSAGRKPSDPPTTPPWVADVAQIAWDLFGMIPVAGELAEAKKLVEDVKKGIGVVKSAQKAAGANLPKKEAEVKVKTADEIYQTLTKTLHKDYLGEYQKALDGVHSSGVTKPGAPAPGDLAGRAFSGQQVLTLMAEVKRRQDWQLPEVPAKSLRDPGGPGDPPDQY